MLAAFLAVLCVPAEAAASPDVGDLRQALSAFDQHAAFSLPKLDEDQLQELVEGEVVRVLEPGAGGARRAVGLVLSDATRDQLWVAAQDLHFTADPRLVEERLSIDPDSGRARWYGHLDLPMPVRDRHWVVDVWNNHQLHAATDGAAWEHAWRLVPTGSQLLDQVGISSDSALWTPVNRGAWVVIRLPGGRTLLGYHATSDIGGAIPDELVARFVHMGLERMLRRISERAAQRIPSHYVGAHEPLPAGGPGHVPPGSLRTPPTGDPDP